MANRRRVGNLLALAILAVLAPGRPMHPYELAGVLRRTGKDRDMRIKWGSLYTVVGNLEKHGLIEPVASGRAGRRPERTVYAITEAGRAELTDWVRELVAVPEPEHPRFEAALSVLGVLPPAEAVALLTQRLSAIEADVAAGRAELARYAGVVADVFLIEVDYALAMREAEAAWVRALLARIADGTLSGVEQWRAYHESGGVPPEWDQLLDDVGGQDGG